jgi:hypothetical protein
LAYVKQRDVELFESLGGFNDKNKANSDGNGRTVTSGDGALELMSGDMRRELLRQKWEQQEEQLRNKTDIHYQDVLFDGKSVVFLSFLSMYEVRGPHMSVAEVSSLLGYDFELFG